MYSIGRFSALCNVPIKTLRYYDEIDLLKPSYIDAETNYRYYDYDKLEAVKLILLLKSLHIPLGEMKQIIESAAPVQWKSIIDQKISELEKQKEQITEEIEEMKHLKIKVNSGIPLIQEPSFSDCYYETHDEVLVYTLRKKIPIKFIDTLVQDLFNQVYAYNLEVNGHLRAIFYHRDVKTNEAEVELLIPIKNSNDIGGCRMLVGGKYACIKVKGPYTGLPMGYEILKKWLVEKNLTQNGNMIEIYEKGLVPDSSDPRDLRPDLSINPLDFLTKICVPVT
ncbi:MerR family transcriptional regulator [Alkalicoccus daliensis]|uniref:Transcriptional regulator, MerR family n=1 Tax=Alkalicoccus daliensis TaxID=745820 RepID=A0A1H0FSU9_9BACI|nr:MerR family transcriptional regulator [Alkalicoccus daliensis]SDN97717.1 transcriptional regulator, MerR family [Alkalicoccus daliensis]